MPGNIRFIASFSGKSMQPTLREGMQIEVEEVASKEVKLADIILYRNHSAFICHRVIKIIQDKEQRIFVTKGDNQPHEHCYEEPMLKFELPHQLHRPRESAGSQTGQHN